MHWWTVGMVASGVISVAHVAIGLMIGGGILNSGQWKKNPLGVATAAIFVAGGVGYLIQAFLLLQPALGEASDAASGARAMFDWPLVTWNLITAGVALYYLSLRGRYAPLLHGAALYEDLKERQQQALEIHDHVVQGLATAKLAFELEKHDEGMREIEATLEHARSIVNDLLGEAESEISLGPGDLRRRSTAGGHT